MRRFAPAACVTTGLLALFAGCAQDQPAAPSGGTLSATSSARAVDAATFLLTDEPTGAQSVVDIRAKAQNEDEVVVAGRIGGAVDPWVEDSLAFTIVDAAAKACSETEDDACPTPWDFCCESGLSKKKLAIEFVDEAGEVVEGDAKALLGLKELDSIVVRGTARRDDAGNVTILATGVYVKK